MSEVVWHDTVDKGTYSATVTAEEGSETGKLVVTVVENAQEILVAPVMVTQIANNPFATVYTSGDDGVEYPVEYLDVMDWQDLAMEAIDKYEAEVLS